MKTKFGKAGLLTFGLLTFSSVSQPRHAEISKSYGNAPAIEFVMPDQTMAEFKNWGEVDTVEIKSEDFAVQSDSLDKIINFQDKILLEMGLDASNIKDPEKFRAWLLEQANDSEVLRAIGAKNLAEATPKQLVEMATVITGKNLSYSESLERLPETARRVGIKHIPGIILDQSISHLSEEKRMKGLEASAQKPMDEILMNKLTAECSHYAVANEAVFNEIKANFPQKLKNVYLNSVSVGYAHVFNRVTIITAENSAIISFIDPTAADTPYGESYTTYEDYLVLLDQLKNQGVLDQAALIDLGSDYFIKKNPSAEQEWQFIKKNFIQPHIFINKTTMAEFIGNKQAIDLLQHYSAATNDVEQREQLEEILKVID